MITHLFKCLLVVSTLVYGIPAQNGCSRVNNVPNIEAAMSGYDPFIATPFEITDRGVKSQIFDPFEILPDGNLCLHSFIGKAVEAVSCETHMGSSAIHNFNEYLGEMASSFSIDASASVSAGGTYKFFSAAASASGSFKKDTASNNRLLFFQENNGEIIQSKAQCITHEVSVAPFIKPVFTPAFFHALQELHVAAKDPTSQSSDSTFKTFVREYGTHFRGNTHFGSKLIFEKLFTSKSESAEKASARKSCIETSARGSVSAGIKLVASVSAEFAVAAGKCDSSSNNNSYFDSNKIQSSRVISIGSLPAESFEKWAETVKETPKPIQFVLEGIDSLFRTRWFKDSIPVDSATATKTEYLDGQAMYNFFTTKLIEYCNRLRGGDCSSEQIGCGFNSDCPLNTKCINDPNSAVGYECRKQEPKYGGAVIIGGETKDVWKNMRRDSESIKTFHAPDYPLPVMGSAVVEVGSKIVSCGGFTSNYELTSACYSLDRSDHSATWKAHGSLPRTMVYHTADAINSNIWYIHMNKLYDMNADTKVVRTYDLPFKVGYGHCSVSNNTHTYVLGVGQHDNEIWVNSLSSSANEWQMIKSLNNSSYFSFGCLWLDDEIFMTGGIIDGTNNYDDRSVVFNINSRSVYSTEPLQKGRHGHRMMIYEGKPAVLGGRIEDGTATDTIELYDKNLKSWTIIPRRMRNARAYFALVQLSD